MAFKASKLRPLSLAWKHTFCGTDSGLIVWAQSFTLIYSACLLRKESLRYRYAIVDKSLILGFVLIGWKNGAKFKYLVFPVSY